MLRKIFLNSIIIPLLILAINGNQPQLNDITVENVDEYSNVIFNLSETVSYTDFTMDNKIVLDLLEVGSKLDGESWSINRGGIESISVSRIPSADLTRIIIQCDDDYDYSIITPDKTMITLNINTSTSPFLTWSTSESTPIEEEIEFTRGKEEKEMEEEKEPKPPPSTVTRRGISMRLEKADLVTVLRSLAEYSGMNMIIGDEVKGTITVELKGVDWEKALDLILKTKGYTYIIEDRIIRVGTAETFAQEREKGEMAKPLERKVFQLEFTTPDELTTVIKSVLSKRGLVESDERTNSLIVTDIPSALEAAKELVNILDKETPQVAIASKIVDMDRTASRELGLNWQVTNLRNVDWNVEGEVSHTTPPTIPQGVQLNLGTIKNFAKLNATLQAMEQAQKLNTIANPRITTVNNKEATIFGGKRFAITTTDINGQPITRWYQAGIELAVTPHINSLEDITMEITVELSDVIPGTGGEQITQTRASTQSLVKNGQTLVIGGFINKTVSETKTGVPILKSIPIIGNLFSHTSSQERNREVLIFITPHIVESDLGGNF